MEWVPIVFATFKLVVLVTGMFFAVKWHYDQSKKDKDRKKEMRAVLRGTGIAVALFALLLVVLGSLTFELIKVLGMEL
nr:hypothetical protein [uncultured Massilia sp.]